MVSMIDMRDLPPPVKAESYITNCIFVSRDDDPAECLFSFHKNGTATVCLDGYAIVPKDQYVFPPKRPLWRKLFRC